MAVRDWGGETTLKENCIIVGTISGKFTAFTGIISSFCSERWPGFSVCLLAGLSWPATPPRCRGFRGCMPSLQHRQWPSSG